MNKAIKNKVHSDQNNKAHSYSDFQIYHILFQYSKKKKRKEKKKKNISKSKCLLMNNIQTKTIHSR